MPETEQDTQIMADQHLVDVVRQNHLERNSIEGAELTVAVNGLTRFIKGISTVEVVSYATALAGLVGAALVGRQVLTGTN